MIPFGPFFPQSSEARKRVAFAANICIIRRRFAVNNAYKILHKAEFWILHENTPINERQRLIINKLFDGFEGKLTTSKWAKLTKCSQDTALRDISDLVNRRVLSKEAARGRSTNYMVCLPK